jgi:hypothetical protein
VAKFDLEPPCSSATPPPIDILLGSLAAKPSSRAAVRLFLTKSDDCTQLCNVLQMVRNAIGADIPEDWAQRKQRELLERTAQFQQTAGDTARHAHEARGEPPKQPMKLAEAQCVVRIVLHRWLSNDDRSVAR